MERDLKNERWPVGQYQVVKYNYVSKKKKMEDKNIFEEIFSNLMKTINTGAQYISWENQQ